jgi:expansin (peptidoglycan-binding protein)
VIATNLHLLGGYHEIKRLAWDEKQLALSGAYLRAPGLEGKAFVYVPDGYQVLPDSPRNRGSVRLSKVGPNLWAQEVQFKEPRLDWTIPFEAAARP